MDRGPFQHPRHVSRERRRSGRRFTRRAAPERRNACFQRLYSRSTVFASIYESKQSPSEVLSKYDTDLPARGWQRRPVNLDGEGAPIEAESRARAFTKDGRLLLVAVDDWGNDVSGVVFVEMGTLGTAQAWAE